MSMAEKFKGSGGTELFISVLSRYRVLALVYVALHIINTVITPPSSVIRWVLAILGLMMPLGVIAALFIKSAVQVKLSRWLFVASFAGSLAGGVWSLAMQLQVIFSQAFAQYQGIYKVSTFLNVLGSLMQVGISIGFLCVLIFNITSKKTGVVLLALTIVSVALTVINLVSFLVMLDFKALGQLPDAMRQSAVMNFARVGVGFVTWGVWTVVTLYIIGRIKKPLNA